MLCRADFFFPFHIPTDHWAGPRTRQRDEGWISRPKVFFTMGIFKNPLTTVRLGENQPTETFFFFHQVGTFLVTLTLRPPKFSPSQNRISGSLAVRPADFTKSTRFFIAGLARFSPSRNRILGYPRCSTGRFSPSQPGFPVTLITGLARFSPSHNQISIYYHYQPP